MRGQLTTVDQLEHFRVIDNVAEFKSSEKRDNKGGVEIEIAKVGLDLRPRQDASTRRL